MSSKLRRFEILLPLQFNDGREVPRELLGEAVSEIVDRFGAVSYEPQTVEGHWTREGVVYRDALSKIVVDIADTPGNRKWMRSFKSRWLSKFDQVDLWLISYKIEVD